MKSENTNIENEIREKVIVPHNYIYKIVRKRISESTKIKKNSAKKYLQENPRTKV